MNGSIKGILGEWFHVTTGKTKYLYPPMWCTSSESKEWIQRKEIEMKQTQPEYRFGTMIFWKLDMESLVHVSRDKNRMDQEMVPVFQNMWKDIQYHRKNGGKELGFNKPACDGNGNDEHNKKDHGNISMDGYVTCSHNILSGSVFLDDSDNDSD